MTKQDKRNRCTGDRLYGTKEFEDRFLDELSEDSGREHIAMVIAQDTGMSFG